MKWPFSVRAPFNLRGTRAHFLHSLGVVCLATHAIPSLPHAAGDVIEWVGEQSDQTVSPADTGSFFDGLMWHGFDTPGPDDVVVFNDRFFRDFDNPPAHHVVFGDFFKEVFPANDVFIPGQDALAKFLDVSLGSFVFDLGGHALNVRPNVNVSGTLVGSDGNTAHLTLKGGGILSSDSARLGDSGGLTGDGSRGVLTVRDSGTSFETRGYLQVGTGSTTGELQIVGGGAATMPVGTGAFYVGGDRGGGVVTISGRGSAMDVQVSNGAAFLNNSLLEVKNRGRFATNQVRIYDQALIDGIESALIATESVMVREDGTLQVVNHASLEASSLIVSGELILGSDATVDAGTLKINETGELRGNGTVHTGEVINFGLISPGESPGLLIINGNFNNQGEIVMEIAGPEDFDQIQVNGDFSSGSDSSIRLDFLDGFVPNRETSYPIFAATGVFQFDGELSVTGLPQGLHASFNGGALLVDSESGVINGDYNNSGAVEQADLDLVLLNWGQSFSTLPADWQNQRPSTGNVDQQELDGVLLNWGDQRPSSGNVDQQELDGVLLNWGDQVSALSGSAVPEPGAGLLVAGFLVIVLGKRVLRHKPESVSWCR